MAHTSTLTTTPQASLASLQTLTQRDMDKVNGVILHAVDEQHVPLIAQITHHIVKSGGKRLRPTLTVACARLLGHEGNRHINLAAAVELIHTATLLHDDVVDESTLRRGIETANTVWSNQASVLVGDFLLSRAFQLMVADGSLDVLTLLSNASATISQGEVKQLMVAGDLSTTRKTYLDIIHAKTAALFSAACEIAPIIHNRPALRQDFRQFGQSLGVAFQLVDDILDYSASQATLGKTIGDDLREGKLTLPVIEALAQANEQEQHFWQRVIGEGDYREGDIDEAIQILKRHGAINKATKLAQDYITAAREALYRIDGHPDMTEALDQCLAFCIERAG